MALSTSNVVPPAQAALNSKKNPSPFGYSSPSVSPTAYSTGTLPQAPGINWGKVGNAIVGGANAVGNFVSNAGAKSTIAQGLNVGSQQNQQPANVFGNSQNPISPFGIVQASAPKAQPDQPVASQVHTDTQGNSVKTTYQPAITGGGATSGTKVDTSSFTPAQLAAFNSANALGSGVQTTNTAPTGSTVASTQNPTFSTGDHAVLPTGGVAGTPITQPTDQQTPQNQQQQNPQQNQQYSASNPPTYPGLVSGLANFNPFNNEQVSGAYQNAQGAQAYLTNLQKEQADALRTAGNGQGIPIGELTGREGLINNYYANLQDAGARALQGYGSIYQGGFSGTGQQESALSSAAGAAKPTVEGYGQTTFNPLTQSFGNGGSGGNLDPQTQATSLAQQVMNAQITYDQAVSSLGYAGSVGTNFLNNAITSAGGNPLNLQAQGSTQQQIIGTQGQQQAAYQSAHQQAQNLQSQLSDLITTFGLNPNDLNAANAGLQKIASNVSDPHYKALSNYLSDIAARYATVLTPTGGSQTDTTRGVASGLVDGIASGKSILDVLNSLDQQAQAVIAGVSTTGANGSSGSSSGGSSVSGFGWSGN